MSRYASELPSCGRRASLKTVKTAKNGRTVLPSQCVSLWLAVHTGLHWFSFPVYTDLLEGHCTPPILDLISPVVMLSLGPCPQDSIACHFGLSLQALSNNWNPAVLLPCTVLWFLLIQQHSQLGNSRIYPINLVTGNDTSVLR